MPLNAATTNRSLIPGSEHIRSPVRLGTIPAAAVKELRWMNDWNRSLRVKRPNQIRGMSQMRSTASLDMSLARWYFNAIAL